MSDPVAFLKAHKSQIISIGKKIFTWWKKRKATQQGGGGGAAGGYGSGQQDQGAWQQPQQQQQQWNQQPQQQQQWGQPQPGYGQYGQGPPPQQQSQWNTPPPQGQYQPQQYHGQSGVKPQHGKYDDNQVNQANAQYKALRDQARQEGDAMARAFDAAHAAHSQNDGARAKQLSNEGHQHQQRMHDLNEQAADWIFKANNEDSPPGTVDLHGLYTQEAIARTERAVQQAQSERRAELRVIVGKGIHSKDKVQHLAPAVEKLMRDYNLAAQLDPHNAGVLVVNLSGGGGGARDASFTRELAQQTTGSSEDCTIM